MGVMTKIALGMMSGTSADGLSIALASFSERRFQTLDYQTFDYPAALRKQVLGAISLSVPQLSQLNMTLGNFYADAAVRFLKRHKNLKIEVIGSHGQTVYHGPNDATPNTLQIGEPSVIAVKTGLPVVSDFRMMDIAAGGEGAPLIPFFDQFFFGGGKSKALQNIGGIGNVTITGKTEPVVAFDTGPGNCLVDLAIEKLSRGKNTFDKSGAWAKRGKVLDRYVQTMGRHPYFKKRPPKSTGRELFSESFIPRALWKEKKEDILATLTYFTAWSIAKSLPASISEMIVSGGGAFNETLMMQLRTLVQAPVHSIEKYGVHPQAKEPVAFAFFALRAVEGKINHAPKVTGAKTACVLGKINVCHFDDLRSRTEKSQGFGIKAPPKISPRDARRNDVNPQLTLSLA